MVWASHPKCSLLVWIHCGHWVLTVQEPSNNSPLCSICWAIRSKRRPCFYFPLVSTQRPWSTEAPTSYPEICLGKNATCQKGTNSVGFLKPEGNPPPPGRGKGVQPRSSWEASRQPFSPAPRSDVMLGRREILPPPHAAAFFCCWTRDLPFPGDC